LKDGRYTNLDGTTPDKGFGAIFKWQVTDRLAGKRPKGPPAAATPTRPNDGAALLPLTPHLTWIGHASFVQRLGGKLLVTDPVWGNVPGGIKRLAPPGVALRALPPVDVVSISHSHYDHLDLPTLRALADGPAKNATFIVPENVGEVLTSAGIANVVELPWWGAYTVGDLRVTLVPAQHWSMRVPWDRNRRLWGGFVYEGLDAAGGTSWHTGDTAFSEEVFTAIGERFPHIDWAMLPIGAYDPAWFMQPQHMNPEEAIRAWELAHAKVLVAMHWGTFKLTDEPSDEPPRRVREEWAKRGHDPARLWVLDVGETRSLPVGR
jgi:L-ascorbate metabolism protein UlaG (beta-lactamase superfamily)